MFGKKKRETVPLPTERRLVRQFKTNDGNSATFTLEGYALGQLRQKDFDQLVSEGWKVEERGVWTTP